MEARMSVRAAMLAAALALAGCNDGAPAAKGDAEPASPAAEAAAAPAVVPASDLLIRAHDGDIDFGWRMVPDVAAFPGLLAELRQDATARLAETRKSAAEDRAARPADAPFFRHSFAQDWRVAADTPRLLSLVAETDTFSGGAHGMHITRGLIWDKQLKKRLAFSDLFADWAAARKVIEPAYCRELDEERAQRRGTAKIGGLFDDCPPLLEQAVTLAGWNENSSGGVRIYLDPYTAGPYAEGTYALWLFPEPEIATMLKPEYRPDQPER